MVLRGRTTYKNWRDLKAFLVKKGSKLLAGDEQRIRSLIKLLSDSYESGETAAGVVYYRAVNIVQLLERFVAVQARKSRLTRRIGVTHDRLRVSVLIDKGGGSTKCLLNVWDVDVGASPHHSVLLGVFVGDDIIGSLRTVFGHSRNSAM